MRSNAEQDTFDANCSRLKNRELDLFERVLGYTNAYLVADDRERKTLFLELEIAAMEARLLLMSPSK